VPDRKKRKLETQTAQPLQVAPPIEKEDPVQKILGTLYSLALDGNVTAAKLYLDFCARQSGDEPDALTPDQALALLRVQDPPPD
jgi:hypothetical protein